MRMLCVLFIVFLIDNALKVAANSVRELREAGEVR